MSLSDCNPHHKAIRRRRTCLMRDSAILTGGAFWFLETGKGQGDGTSACNFSLLSDLRSQIKKHAYLQTPDLGSRLLNKACNQSKCIGVLNCTQSRVPINLLAIVEARGWEDKMESRNRGSRMATSSGMRHSKAQSQEQDHKSYPNTYFSLESFLLLLFFTASLLILPLILPPLPPPPSLLLLLPIGLLIVLMILAFMPTDIEMSSTTSKTKEKNASGSRTDIGWQHGVDVENNSKKVKCKYCDKTFNDGIFRFKHHLAGTHRDVEPCLTVSDNVKNKMQSIVDKLAKVADKRKRKSYGIDDSDDEEPLPKATDKGKMKMDTFSRSKKGSNFGSTQATINQMMKKELRDEACQEIARKSKKEELFTIDDLSSDDECITEENDHIDGDDGEDLDQINEVDGHDVEPIHLVYEEGSGNVTGGADDISSIVHHANDGSDGDNDSDETSTPLPPLLRSSSEATTGAIHAKEHHTIISLKLALFDSVVATPLSRSGATAFAGRAFTAPSPPHSLLRLPDHASRRQSPPHLCHRIYAS
ncbi:hypothetical protein ZIOFF_067643 [Zingiber officinale]|uniref:BED-type domain-containing protein n=1 Tax=Zingiber officinale TaxID=94328 RepID=A0A8J5CDL5_ZINOF|nr:hypothetical protein ZIOFF_067643 [Zingiber officinale]